MAEKKSAAGRPLKNFDKETFEGLCRLMATEAEICDFFQTTDKTLSNWCRREYGKNFSETYKILSSKGKMSLRRRLIKAAEAGNTAALIFACKNYLHMRDNPEDAEEREVRLAAMRAKADGAVSPNAGKQVIIINDTRDDTPGANPAEPPDNP